MNQSHGIGLRLSFLGMVVSLALPPAAHAQVIAYRVTAGTVGNQDDLDGALGMDFDVNATIHVTALGVFDSGQNGLAFDTPVYIYDRNTHLSVVSLVIPAGKRQGTITIPVRKRGRAPAAVVAEETGTGAWGGVRCEAR